VHALIERDEIGMCGLSKRSQVVVGPELVTVVVTFRERDPERREVARLLKKTDARIFLKFQQQIPRLAARASRACEAARLFACTPTSASTARVSKALSDSPRSADDIPSQRDLMALLAQTPGITVPRVDVGGALEQLVTANAK